jgi:hypothetical protein
MDKKIFDAARLSTCEHVSLAHIMFTAESLMFCMQCFGGTMNRKTVGPCMDYLGGNSYKNHGIRYQGAPT